MGYMIVSGTKPSSVALHQNHANVFTEMLLLIKCQIFILNRNMPKTKWEGSEDDKIKHFFKIESIKFNKHTNTNAMRTK